MGLYVNGAHGIIGHQSTLIRALDVQMILSLYLIFELVHSYVQFNTHLFIQQYSSLTMRQYLHVYLSVQVVMHLINSVYVKSVTLITVSTASLTLLIKLFATDVKMKRLVMVCSNNGM